MFQAPWFRTSWSEKKIRPVTKNYKSRHNGITYGMIQGLDEGDITLWGIRGGLHGGGGTCRLLPGDMPWMHMGRETGRPAGSSVLQQVSWEPFTGKALHQLPSTLLLGDRTQHMTLSRWHRLCEITRRGRAPYSLQLMWTSTVPEGDDEPGL